jgi:hypothetical protein
MSGQTEATRQSDYIVPPRKSSISVIAVTSTSAATTMATYGQTALTSGVNYGSHGRNHNVYEFPGHSFSVCSDEFWRYI